MNDARERLAEILLGQPLDRWVRTMRARGLSWARISRDLFIGTEIEMSGETLRTTYPDPDKAASA
jgi:hypothetical protein